MLTTLQSLYLLHPIVSHRTSSKKPLKFFCFNNFPKSNSTLTHHQFIAFSNINQNHKLRIHDDEEEEYDDDEEDEEISAEEYDVDESIIALDRRDESEEEEEEEVVTAQQTAVSEEEKCKRVERLLAQVKELGDDIIDYDELAYIYDFPVDKFQRLSIQSFLRGSSVVVSAPTSSGKTLIAEAAAIATVARGRRLFYTTPLKALSNQKFREFRKTFGENNVGLLTGDSAINKDAQILIMTTEILRNMLYQSVGLVSSGSNLLHVDVIVLDEVHYLSDISRGTVWEEIIIYCPKEVQLICLSATVANPDELAGWIGQIHGKTELVTSIKRPVPLTWHFSLKNSMLRLLDERGKKMNRKLSLNYMQSSMTRTETFRESDRRKYRSGKTEHSSRNSTAPKQASLLKGEVNSTRRNQVPQIRDTLRQLRTHDMLPAIWFIFSRRGCDAAVQYIEDCKLLDECEAGEVELELRKFRMQYPDAVREVAIKGLRHGIAAHHAGCLPLWKSFIEELFQKGLVKVVFATETLAAGINMPARTAVIASISKRGQTGRALLSSNELHQMAGRSGRRGIDDAGHVVLVQTAYEGAEECCEILFAGLEPLVSQFTASYGMVLNLLAGSKITSKIKEQDEANTLQPGRTLEEARKLVEQSFGNYVGSNVMLAAKDELNKIQKDIELLSLEVGDDAVDRKCKEQLTERDYEEITNLQEELRAEKRLRTELRQKMELKRMAAWKSLLEDSGKDHLPFMCLQYKDNESVQHTVPAVYIGNTNSFNASKIISRTYVLAEDEHNDDESKPTYYVALGSDNSWYLFTEKWVKIVYKTGFPNVISATSNLLPRESLTNLLLKEDLPWEKLADSESGSIWCMEGSLDTWSWSLNVPVLSSMSEDDEVKHGSQDYEDAVRCFKEQRRTVSRLKKKITSSKGFKEFKAVIDKANFTKEKIARLEARASRLTKRIEQIEPSGWKEFLQISRVIQETKALDIDNHCMFPLGETAAAIRGENELWLAMVLRNKILVNLKPAQLAAVCGGLVSEGIKVRPWKNNSYIYEASSTVLNVINRLEEQRTSFMELQEKCGVKISCGLDTQFCGMVEAWASGLTWKELLMDCAMDEGDVARLLRRTIDLLAQIPKLPDIDPLVQKNASLASGVMDRAPISELAG